MATVDVTASNPDSNELINEQAEMISADFVWSAVRYEGSVDNG